MRFPDLTLVYAVSKNAVFMIARDGGSVVNEVPCKNRYAVGCRYNAVQYNRTLHKALRWLRKSLVHYNDIVMGTMASHQPHHCLLDRLFGRRWKKTSKLRVTGHCAGNSPGTGEFPVQMASNAENVSIWWRHHSEVELKKDPPIRRPSGRAMWSREDLVDTNPVATAPQCIAFQNNVYSTLTTKIQHCSDMR